MIKLAIGISVIFGAVGLFILIVEFYELYKYFKEMWGGR